MFFQTFQQLSCHSTNLVLTLRFYVIASNSKRKPVKFVVFLHTISMQKIMAYTKGALFFYIEYSDIQSIICIILNFGLIASFLQYISTFIQIYCSWMIVYMSLATAMNQ